MKNYSAINEAINSLMYHYQYPKRMYVSRYTTYIIDWYDGRTKSVRLLKENGYSKKEVADILQKKIIRRNLKNEDSLTNDRRLSFLKMVSECEFNMAATSSRYNCTGIDWKAYHRPSSNGKGWVLIAPDEPGNNWYIEDNIIFKLLSKKFLN